MKVLATTSKTILSPSTQVPTLSDREKLEDARQMFLNAWRTGLANALNPGGTAGTTNTPSVRDMQIPEKGNQMDFRNRGVR